MSDRIQRNNSDGSGYATKYFGLIRTGMQHNYSNRSGYITGEKIPKIGWKKHKLALTPPKAASAAEIMPSLMPTIPGKKIVKNFFFLTKLDNQAFNICAIYKNKLKELFEILGQSALVHEVVGTVYSYF